MVSNHIKERRRERLLALLEDHDGVQVELANTLKKSPSQVNHWLSGLKGISEDSAREIERNAKKPPGWLDAPLTAETAATAKAVATTLGNYAAHASRLPKNTQRQLERLDPAGLAHVSNMVGLLAAIQARNVAESTTWRDVALRLAAAADLQAGNDQFTQFCLAVDRQFDAAA